MTVIPAMIDLLDGKEVSAQAVRRSRRPSTKDNIRELYPDTPACD